VIYHNLYERSAVQTVTAAIIGTGHFSTALIAQAKKHPRLRVAALADRDAAALEKAMSQAEILPGEYALCDTAAGAERALRAGKIVCATQARLLFELPISIFVECTGNPEAGALHAVSALEAGRHVVMVNKETDSCVGPILRAMAEKKNLIYTPVDGDQHGALMQLVEWARDNGVEVISAGKSRDAEFIYDKKAGTITVYSDGGITIPKTITASLEDSGRRYFEELPESRKAEYLERRRDILKALNPRGGFDLCEMVIAANATGLAPAVSLLNDYILRTPEIPKVLCGAAGGGLLAGEGVVDVITNLHEPCEAGLGGGVFVVVRAENSYSRHILATKGCLSNKDGTAALVYRPYHLCGVEAPTTLLCAGLLGVGTGSRRYRQDYDIVQEAAVDLRAGEVMGGDHDTRLLTHIVPASPLAEGGPVPAHLLNGRALSCDVKKGTMITCKMIDRPEDSLLWNLREKQDDIK
jgi:predicted homoserine dehydrogenase-like protein